MVLLVAGLSLFAPLDMGLVVAGLILSVLLDMVPLVVGLSLFALLAVAAVMMILILSVEPRRECPAATSLSHTSMAYILFPGWKTTD